MKNRPIADEQKPPFQEKLKFVLQAVITPILAVYLLLGVLGGLAIVNGPSMNPSLYNHDLIVFQRLGYIPKYGDIVIVNAHRYPLLLEEDSYQEELIKRVIGLPGDILEFDEENQVIYRNGEVLDEPYLAPNELVDGKERGTEPFAVPDGYIFIMGDNRQHSADSRSSSVWDVSMDDIVGGVLFSFGIPFLGH